MATRETIADHIYEPSIFLTGCQAWPPAGWIEHATEGGPCPVCGDGIKPGDHGTYCGWSDEGSPAFERRVRAAQLGLKAASAAEIAVRQLREDLAREYTRVLTESERRRIWNGYKGSIRREVTRVTNFAKECREFLIRLNQIPDWDAKLKVRGRA